MRNYLKDGNIACNWKSVEESLQNMKDMYLARAIEVDLTPSHARRTDPMTSATNFSPKLDNKVRPIICMREQTARDKSWITIADPLSVRTRRLIDMSRNIAVRIY